MVKQRTAEDIVIIVIRELRYKYNFFERVIEVLK